MAYITEVPDGLIGLDVDGGVVLLDNNQLVNNVFANPDYEIVGDIDATNNSGGDPLIAEEGETLTVETNGGGTITGEYIGAYTWSSSDATIGLDLDALGGLGSNLLSGVLNLDVTLNPIDGYIIQDDDGTFHFISETSLAEDHFSVNVTFTLLGQTFDINADVSNITGSISQAIRDYANSLPITSTVTRGALNLVANLVDSTTNLTQQVLDTIVIDIAPTVGPDPLDVTCFTFGTLIQSAEGLVAVENLKAGDLVMTRDNGLQAVRWIGSSRVDAAKLARSPELRPIRIKAGALGTGVPASDLLVSPQHRVMVRSKIAQRLFGTDEVLVAAKQLLQLDGFDIAEDQAEVEYFHILFDRHEIVISNGAATESLYTGGEALKSVGNAAREEIFTLFPELREGADLSPAARPLSSGRMARKLAVRHMQHGKPLYH